MPASGMLNWDKVAVMTTRLARGTPATPFEVIIRVRSINDLLGQGEIDAIGLGDEDRREGHVHHRAVEVERVAERQDEAGDPRRHSEPVERLQGAREGGLRRGGRESQNDRVPNVADEEPGPLSDDQEADSDQQDPEDREAEIEAADELTIGLQDRRTALGDAGAHRGEDGDGSEAHHVIGDLKHHLDQRLERPNERPCRLADRGDGDSEEKREDDDLENVVLRHRPDHRLREDVGDELGEIESRPVDSARRVGGRDGEGEAHPGLEQR